MAFEEVMRWDLRPGETASVYELELRQLASQAKVEKDAVTLHRFVTGLPSSSTQLRMMLILTNGQLRTVVAAVEDMLTEQIRRMDARPKVRTSAISPKRRSCPL